MGDLYEQDFIGWTEQQARLLRQAAARRVEVPLDWDHLAEEIEDLGRSHYLAVAREVHCIVLHLSKLQFTGIVEPRAGWIERIAGARVEIESYLETDPGLKPRLAEIIRRETARAAKRAARAVQAQAEDVIGRRWKTNVENALRRDRQAGETHRHAKGDYSINEILGDWLPDRDEPR